MSLCLPSPVLRTLVLATWAFCAQVSAQTISDAELQRRQAQQQEAVRGRAAVLPDVLTNTQASGGELVLPTETPCFLIREIEWGDTASLAFLRDAQAGLVNHCIGAKALHTLQDYLTSLLLAKGYITSRILIPEQNLAGGRLVLDVVPGRIGVVHDQGAAAGWLGMALPAGPGALLNQRDLDQALENMRRLTSEQSVEFELRPGSKLGETDIVIKHSPAKRWHALLSLDDSGTKSTGKYQLSGVFTLDSPLHLYDLLTLSVNNNANATNNTLGSTSTALSWNVPYGYLALLADATQSRYKQTVAGFDSDIVYSGVSRSVSIGLGVVPFRSSVAKSNLQFRLVRKFSRSDIDDTEILVQRRDTVGYDASFTYRYFFGATTLDAGVGLRGSIPSWSSAPGLIIGAPEWNGRYQVQSANLALTVPFNIGAQKLRQQTSWRLQHSPTLLPPTEYFSVGNRYSVRGFDGATTLAAEDGWLLRNDLTWQIGGTMQEVYLAVDHGHVGGTNATQLLGRSLTGAALGWRAQFSNLHIELTAGLPLAKPAGFTSQHPTYTASVAAEF